MKPQEFLDNYHLIIQSLDMYNELFYKLAAVGKPMLTESIPTASVGFDRTEGNFLMFMFNPNFLEKLSFEQVRFVIAHEMLHIILMHGKRMKDAQSSHGQAINVAQDIVINESLIENFGFNRADIDPLPALSEDEDPIKPCMIDTVFKEKANKVRAGASFEHYYNFIKENAEETEGYQIVIQGPNGGTIDDHSNLPTMSEEELKDVLEEATGDLEEAEKIMDEIKKAQQAGTAPSPSMFDKAMRKPPKKRKWEHVPASIRKTKKRINYSPTYQWVKPDRRSNILPTDVMLPAYNSNYNKNKSKWDLWIFQDVSGSCAHWTERFLNAARSIPTDVFDIRFHVFDTSIQKIDINSNKFPYGGGTYFHIIEDYIQNHTVKKDKIYPRLVFIITDGYGNDVQPAYPKNWFWFMTEGNNKSYCHPESKVFELSEFESVGAEKIT